MRESTTGRRGLDIAEAAEDRVVPPGQRLRLVDQLCGDSSFTDCRADVFGLPVPDVPAADTPGRLVSIGSGGRPSQSSRSFAFASGASIAS
jgi:hypothetical protein